MILTPLQKLPNILGDLGKIIVANSFERLPKVQKIAQSGHTVGSSFYSKCGQIVKLRPKEVLMFTELMSFVTMAIPSYFVKVINNNCIDFK